MIDYGDGKKRYSQGKRRREVLKVPQSPSPSPTEPQPFIESHVVAPTKHIISIEDITINKELGMGQFGVVQQGTWNTGKQRLQVAIKCLGHERMTSNSTEFLKEAAVMHSIEHPNVVRLYGVVLHLDNLMLVTELAPLRSLLECLREVSLRPNFPVPTLCEFAEQICDGMTYLEQKRLIHRDLAARNILVFTKDKVKISDFGLSRALGVGKDYYQTNYNVNLKLPVAWCAPECILYLRFTSASDVWAFGVCLWEMFTYGFQPWAAFSGQQILEAIDAPNYQRLERPECCPAAYYTAMLHCWEHESSDRPKFKDLCLMLRKLRPEQVQATTDYIKPEDGRRGNFLEYKAGQIITVLNKECMNTCLWYGVLPGGTCGVFDPNQTKPYVRQEPPHQVVTPYKPADDMEVPLLNSPSHTKAGRCKPPYPPNLNPDFHEVHLPYVGPLPMRTAYMKTPESDEEDDTSMEEPSKNPKKFSKNLDPTTSKSIINKVKSATTLGRSRSEEGAACLDGDIHEYHEISDTDTDSPTNGPNSNIGNLELPDSPVVQRPFWKSLALSCFLPSTSNNRQLESEPPSRSMTLDKIDKKKNGDMGTMKPMSAHDIKTLDTAVALANEITSKSMSDLDTELKASKSTDRVKGLKNLKFTGVSLHHHDNGKSERRNFSEEAKNVRDIQATLSEESKQAYMSLIEEPTPSVSLLSQMSDEMPNIGPKPVLKPKPMTLPIGLRPSRPYPRRFNSFNKPRLPTPESSDDDIENNNNNQAVVQVPSDDESSEPSGEPHSEEEPPVEPKEDDDYDEDDEVFEVQDAARAVDAMQLEEDDAALTDHVSVEDLLEFADLKPHGRQRGVESDEVRIMIKVLKREMSPEDCLQALDITNWDVHQAIKVMRVRLSIGDTVAVTLDDCARELAYHGGDVLKATTILVLSKPTKEPQPLPSV